MEYFCAVFHHCFVCLPINSTVEASYHCICRSIDSTCICRPIDSTAAALLHLSPHRFYCGSITASSAAPSDAVIKPQGCCRISLKVMTTWLILIQLLRIQFLLSPILLDIASHSFFAKLSCPIRALLHMHHRGLRAPRA